MIDKESNLISDFTDLSSLEISTPIPGGAVMLVVIMVEKFFKINFKDVHPTDIYLLIIKEKKKEMEDKF